MAVAFPWELKERNNLVAFLRKTRKVEQARSAYSGCDSYKIDAIIPILCGGRLGQLDGDLLNAVGVDAIGLGNRTGH